MVCHHGSCIGVCHASAGRGGARAAPVQDRELDASRSAWLRTGAPLRETVERHAGEYKDFMKGPRPSGDSFPRRSRSRAKRALESYGRTPILFPARVSTMSIVIGLSR